MLNVDFHKQIKEAVDPILKSFMENFQGRSMLDHQARETYHAYLTGAISVTEALESISSLARIKDHL